MKHLFTAAAMLFSMTAFAQVGINNTSPKATLDITAKTTDGSKPEGLIIPQLSGSNIHTATAAGVYGTNQKGLIIYATSADSSPISATANITTAGYYYFDGTNWQKVMTGSVANSDLTTGVGGIYKGSGSLSGNTTVTQGGNTLAFTSTATNGFSVDGTTLSVDAANNRVGIGINSPGSKLQVDGSLGLNYINISSATYTIAANDYYLNYTGNSDASFTLPTGTTSDCNCKGRAYEIVNNSNYNITVNAALSEAINGNSSFVITAKTVAKIVNTNVASGNTWSNVYYSPIEFSANQGSITTKTLYNSSSSDLTKTVRIGRFEIRANGSLPEFRLVNPPSSNVVIYRNVEQNWENNGYSSNTYSNTFTTSNWNTYQSLADYISYTEKNTYWLAYPGDSTLVKVEILAMGNGTASTTWAIICTQY